MKKILLSTFAFSFCFLSVSLAHASSPNLSRDERIEREMNCIREHVQDQKQLDWQDVCYTNQKEDRETTVARSMEEVIEEQKNLFPDQNSEEMYEKGQDQFYNDWGSKSPKRAVQKNVTQQDMPSDAPPMEQEQQETIKATEAEWDDVLDRPDAQPRSYSDALDSPKQVIEIGTETYSYDYEETLTSFDDLNFVRLNGQFWGVFLNYTARPDEDDPMHMDVVDYYRVETRFVRASGLEYDSAGTGSSDDSDDFVLELRGVGGKAFPFSPSLRLTPYIGLAFRYLNDDSSGNPTSTGHIGYERESRYFYAPLGVLLEKQVNARFKLSLTGEFDWFLSGTQKSHLSDVHPLLGDIDNDQESGYGLRSSVKLTKLGQRFDVFVEPFVRFWHIRDSELAVSSTGIIAGVEPENRTNELGVKFGAEF